MVSRIGKLVIWGTILAAATVLAGPYELGARADELTGGGTPCKCKWTQDCYPGCVGSSTTFSECGSISDEDFQCSVDTKLYPCGAGEDCEQLHTASGNTCPR